MKNLNKNFNLYDGALNVSSFLNFSLSLFKRVSVIYWIYAVVISILFSLENKNLTLFKNLFDNPDYVYNAQIINIYTIIVIILLPIPLVYIRFVKSFGFSSLYIKMLEAYRESERKRMNDNNVYSTDEYKFEPAGKDSWTVKNISAKRRRRNNGSFGSIMSVMFPFIFFVFLMLYMYIMYHIVILVFILVFLHMFYMYKKKKKSSFIYQKKEEQKMKKY